MAGQAVFERALGELKERRMAPAVWARALAEAGGDKQKAVSIYIKYRVEQIEGAPAQAAQLAGSAHQAMPPLPPSGANPLRATPPPSAREAASTAVSSMQPAFNSSYAGHPPPISPAGAGVRVPPQPPGQPSQAGVRNRPSASAPAVPMHGGGNSELTVMMGEDGEELPRTGLTCARTRYRARLLDATVVFSLVMAGLLVTHYAPGADGGEGTTTPVTLSWTTYAAVNVITVTLDTLIYCVFGNSLGKALFSVEVRKNGAKIGRGQYLLRNLAVFTMGFGLSLPFVTLVTQTWQYFRLKSGKQAIYDDLLNMQTVCREDRPGRRKLGDAILMFFAIAYTLLLAVSKQY